MQALLTDRSEQTVLNKKPGRLHALLLEKKQTIEPSVQVGGVYDRKQTVLSERGSRSTKKKPPRSNDNSKNRALSGLRSGGAFAN